MLACDACFVATCGRWCTEDFPVGAKVCRSSSTVVSFSLNEF